MVLSSEEDCMVNMRSRVNITRLVSPLASLLNSQGRQEYFMNFRKMLRILGGNPQNYNFNPENMKTLDNFLEANLDAQLIHDEIKIDSELEKVPDKDLESLLLKALKT